MRSNNFQEAKQSCSNGSRSRGAAGNLRFLIERRCLAPLTSNDDVDDGDGRRRSCSYQKLPQLQHLKLTVVKLDGSAFEVDVARSATVAELKKAVEEVFTSSPKEGQDKICWSLVWGHFCLCYEGQKLTSDKAYIRNYGIKEGDQLRFIRHMSTNYSPLTKRPKKGLIAYTKESTLGHKLSSSSNTCEEKEQTNMNENQENIDLLEDNFTFRPNEEQVENRAPMFKMAQFLKGWFSYSRLVGVSRRGTECRGRITTSRPTRFGLHLFGPR
ncbi:hypothetical protein UlMin_017418 [Ulmus minor]